MVRPERQYTVPEIEKGRSAKSVSDGSTIVR
jgi:hypothetical protein